MDKLIITVAVTGGVTTRDNNPNLPISPKEIAEDVYNCWNSGASIVHIHARAADGTPSQRIELYQEIIERIREKCDILICLTTTGWNTNGSDEDRLKPLRCYPEFASYTPGSFNRGGKVFINTPEFIYRLANEASIYGVKPEIEIFNSCMIDEAIKLADKGILKKPLNFQFILGVDGGMTASVKNLLFLIENIPKYSNWSVGAVGKAQLSMNLAAIISGGNVRTGFEDNVYLKYKQLALSNAQLVERLTKYSLDFGRDIASPAEARKKLGIQPKINLSKELKYYSELSLGQS